MTDDEIRARMALDERTRTVLERSAETLDNSQRRERPARLWEAPPEPPAPAQEPTPVVRRAAMAPPAPSKIVRPQHDASGRITEARTYEGEQAQALGVWEQYVQRQIRQHVERKLEAFSKALGEEIGRDIGALFRSVELLSDRVAGIEARLSQLEARVAPGPRLVEEPDAA